MTRTLSIALLLAALAAGGLTASAEAHGPWSPTYSQSAMAYHAAQLPWHHGYAYQHYSTPLAHVVPPTAAMQSNYSWGVPSSRMTPIYHQYNSIHPGGVTAHGPLLVTPSQPSNTLQFGVYNVRGPWTYVDYAPTAGMMGGFGHSLHHGGHSRPILPGVHRGVGNGRFGARGVHGVHGVHGGGRVVGGGVAGGSVVGGECVDCP